MNTGELVELNLRITNVVQPLLPEKVAYVMILMDTETKVFVHATNVKDMDQVATLMRDALRQWSGGQLKSQVRAVESPPPQPSGA